MKLKIDQLTLAIEGEITEEPAAQTERARCGINGPRIVFCDALDFALTLNKPWLHTGEMIELRSPKMRYAVILDLGKRGYMDFKFCPFCGAELATVMTDRAEVNRG